jgi:hypothetical protein
VACHQYEPVVKIMKAKQAAAANPFLGMRPGSATQARAARAKGLGEFIFEFF